MEENSDGYFIHYVKTDASLEVCSVRNNLCNDDIWVIPSEYTEMCEKRIRSTMLCSGGIATRSGANGGCWIRFEDGISKYVTVNPYCYELNAVEHKL